jgi:serine/threonine protein kinase
VVQSFILASTILFLKVQRFRLLRNDQPQKNQVEIDTMSAPQIEGFTDLVLIGRGGSASVYRARQAQLERDVAVKVLRPTQIDDRTRQLFDAERRLLGQLPKHQNIVTVFDSGFTADSDPFLAMELCARGSIAALVKSYGPLSLEHGVRVGHRMISALDFAHRRSMIHRDVKPENILISDLGEPVLSDFGIASVLDSDGTATDRAFSPHHVAPELLRGAPPAVTADIYSLGSTLFTLMVGRTPHQNAVGERLPISQILARVSDPYFPIELPGENEFPREFRNLLRSLLAKDPSRRMSRASDAIEALRSIESELGILGRELPLPLVEIPDEDEALHRTSDVDPEATYIGRSTGAPRSPSAGTTAKALRNINADTTLPPPDDDGTVIAPRKATLSGGTFREDATEVVGGPPGTAGAGRKNNADPRETESLPPSKNRLFLAVAAALAVGLIALLAANRFGGGARRFSTTLAPPVQDSNPIVGLSRPSSVTISDLNATSLTISWRGEDDPTVSYIVDVMHGSETVKSTEAMKTPVTITGLVIDGWVPCVVVSASSGNGVLATADPVCAAGPPPTTQETKP